MPRHLIVKIGALGDVIMAAPAVKRFKEAAGGEVDWLCGRAALPLVERWPWVDGIIAVDDHALLRGTPAAALCELAGIWKRLGGRFYDSIAVLHYDWRYRLTVWPVRAARRITLRSGDRRRMLVPGRHHTDEYARILLDRDDRPGERLGPVVARGSGGTAVLGEGRRARVILVPGGARNRCRDDPQRRWPLPHYLRLAELLQASDLEVVLIGGPEDIAMVRAFPPSPRLRNLTGRLPLERVLDVIAECALVVSHDTGPLHLAGMTSTPILALFGPTVPGERRPQREDVTVLWGGERLACRPCYDGKSYAPCSFPRCLAEIAPEQVFEKAMQILAQKNLD